MIRYFALADSRGETINLTDPKDVFFEGPSGLGFDLDFELSDAGSGFFMPGAVKYKPEPITGALIFVGRDKAYARYRQVTDWVLRRHGDLHLIYDTGGAPYYRDVTVQSMDKSELDEIGLRVPIKFLPLSPYYTKDQRTLTIGSPDPGRAGKTYRYTYSYTYGAKPKLAAGSVRFTLGGHLPGGYHLTVQGELDGPAVEIKSGYRVIGRLSLPSVKLASYDVLEVYCFQQLRIVYKNGESQLGALYVDPKYQMFPDLRPGVEYELSVTGRNGGHGEGTLTLYEYYQTR